MSRFILTTIYGQMTNLRAKLSHKGEEFWL